MLLWCLPCGSRCRRRLACRKGAGAARVGGQVPAGAVDPLAAKPIQRLMTPLARLTPVTDLLLLNLIATEAGDPAQWATQSPRRFPKSDRPQPPRAPVLWVWELF